MLYVKDLTVYRGNVQALREVTLFVEKGEIVCLVGSNGAGKSTLLYTIAGALPPTGGQITCEGMPLHGLSAHQVVRRGVSLVPEGRQVFGSLSVLDNLLLGAYVHCTDRWQKLLGDMRHIRKQDQIDRRLSEVFALFPILEERQAQAAGSLSGGEQQMLAIGRALMSSARLLLIDELSMGLAPALVAQLFGLLGRLREMGCTILLVEQDAFAALAVADRGYVLETGRIVAEGTTEELRNSDRIHRAYLGRAAIAARPLPSHSDSDIRGGYT
jgi:branched-chain amino acid transport system ATP-binding protein